MGRGMKRGAFENRHQLQRCAEFGAPRICSYSGFHGLMLDSAGRRLWVEDPKSGKER